MAKTEFGGDPDTLARFRTGVRVGPVAGRLLRELECLRPLLSEYRAQLGWLGANEEFMKRLDTASAQLRDATSKLEASIAAMPEPLAELNCQKGRLLDLVRKLVRIGRLEFQEDPHTAAAFGYALLRGRTAVGAPPARSKTEKSPTR